LGKSAIAITNADDKNGSVMLQNTKAEKRSYSLKRMADYKGKILTNSFSGLELDVNGKDVWFKLTGEFNAYNLLCIYGVADALGEQEDEVLVAMSTLGTAVGRFDHKVSQTGIVTIVDYAHTPDALKNVLQTIEAIKEGDTKVITVVGCGGDRDREKRPVMAEVAVKNSDQVILTSDNPRTEDPEEILNDMEQGVSISFKKKTIRISDRKEAIKLAVTFANPGDVLLVAGKGHETYQDIKGTKTHFSDFEEIENSLKLLNK